MTDTAQTTDAPGAAGTEQDALHGWDALHAARNLLSGSEPDPARDAGYTDPPPRAGFFTDTSVCIGCKACEVACKEWNAIPAGDGAGPDGGSEFRLSGMSYDNTGDLGASTWRHVAFIEQSGHAGRPGPDGPPGPDGRTELPLAGDGGSPAESAAGEDGMRWLMASDVCKHCTHAACLDVCPTGSLFRTEFGTVVVQEDICNGCGYCVPACPYGVIEQRPSDGRAFKCTLCYDRLSAGQEPACAKACPTESIQFGPLDELREAAGRRVRQLQDAGVTGARLYGDDPADGVGGDGAFFLLLDEPEVYGLPPDPVVTTRDLPAMWRHAGAAALSLLAGIAVSFAADALTGQAGRAGRRGSAGRTPLPGRTGRRLGRSRR